MTTVLSTSVAAEHDFGAAVSLRCQGCAAGYPLGPTHVCVECFGPLEVVYDESLLRRVTREQVEAGPRTLWRYQREVRALARTPEHTAGVYSFFVALLQSCRAERAQGLDAALLWWEIGARCARAFHDAGAWQVIRPDGAGEWRVDGQRFRFWLEWDRGTMGPRDLSAKFTAYARYLQSGEWRVDGNEPLPALLIVTQSDEQMARLEQALKEALPTSFLPQVVLALTAELRAHGPLSAIWRRWRVDSAHRHVLLERQWTPVTSVSLP